VSGPFRFFTPASVECPAGRVAADLESLRAGFASVPAACIFHHVTRVPARFPHARDLPENDFARWVRDALQLPEVGERLAFVGSAYAGPIEELRASLLAVIDRVPPGARTRGASDGATFHFIQVQTILAPLDLEAAEPFEVIGLWPRIDLGAAFFHLVEAPLFGHSEQALTPWLRAKGARSLADSAETLVAAGRPLARLHREIGVRWRRSTFGRRLAERVQAPEAERQRDAHEAIAKLAERLKGQGGGAVEP
jgi:hypothetical protein